MTKGQDCQKVSHLIFILSLEGNVKDNFSFLGGISKVYVAGNQRNLKFTEELVTREMGCFDLLPIFFSPLLISSTFACLMGANKDTNYNND